MEIARKLAEPPAGLPKATAARAVVVAFGALCTGAGYNLATPERPHWIVKEPGLTPSERVLSLVLAVPPGRMIFALLIPAALYGAKVGWTPAADRTAERPQRIAGWSLLVACGFGCVAYALRVAEVT